MNTSLAGRRALVCGASQGIGRACAVELASLGCAVTLLARNAPALEAARASLAPPGDAAQAHETLALDFADTAGLAVGVEAAIKSHGGFDIFINNTGGPAAGRAVDAEPAQYAQAFAMHIVTAQTLVRLLVPRMQERRFGRIVNIISTSVKAPIPGLGVSNTIRAAVANWAKTLSLELAPHGITVNNILPGYTDTERLRALMANRAAAQKKTEQAVRDEWLASIPAGRFGEASEVAAVAAFLCTPAAAYVNGVNIPVDGGRTPSL